MSPECPPLALLFAHWGRYRNPSLWPELMKVSPDVLVYHIVKSHPAGLSLSALMVAYKTSVGSKANLDMLNLKAYLRCFPFHFRFTRVGTIDYIHDALAPVAPMSDKEYMRMYGLDTLLAQAIRQARFCCASDPVLFVVHYLLQARQILGAQRAN